MTFCEPGGDGVGGTLVWDSIANTPTAVSTVTHGGHTYSIEYKPSGSSPDYVKSAAGTLSDSGSRISAYVYISALPSATSSMMSLRNAALTNLVTLRLTSAGVLQLWNGTSVQIGSNGATLSTGVWYRISIAYTITSTSINRFEVFLDGVPTISVTNATITTIVTSLFSIGNSTPNGSFKFYSSDHYIDDSSSLTDTGNIWVAAKRPFANGTVNNFVTQIGAGGSGYGSGHAPQVNELPLTSSNGWSVVAVGATTEEYNIERPTVGNIEVPLSSLVDYMGWVYTSSLISETIQIIINGNNFSQAITSSNILYRKIAGSNVYPAGTGTDIGIITDATATTVSLYECGINFAFIQLDNNILPTKSMKPAMFKPGNAR